jgi:hypothetical protein
LALVQTGLVWEGSQALRINSYGASAGVRQLFAATNAPVVWADARTMAWAGGAPTNPAWGSANAYLDDDGYLRVYDGLAASTNKWLVLTNLPPRAMTGEWVRLTVKLDYATQRWLACLDGVLARGNLGFATPVAQFNVMSVEGKRAAVDAICVGTNQPAGLSLDGDNLPDDWELAHFGNLDQVDDGDPDNDKLTNLQEYRLGTDPLVADADTDNDGLPDALENALGTNPLVPDAGADPDNDGLTNLQESQLGTNPFNPDTDGDGMPDGWEVAHGLNPLFNDAARDPDGDGLNNLQEYQANSDPHNPDTDSDGLTDGYEVTNRHTNPTKADTDGDGMPDKWELDHGLNALVNDAALDPDQDGLSNLQEYQIGADPHNADTDGDRVGDGIEAQAHSNPQVADFNGTVTNLLSLAGSAASSTIGTWAPVGSAIYAGERCGSLDYVLPIPVQGTYALAVEVTQQNPLTTQDSFDLLLLVDGVASGRQVVNAAYGTNTVATFFLPALSAGNHVIRLRWINSAANTFLQVNSLTLQSYGGPDANTNGIPDWMDNRASALFGLEAQPQSSVVSPICLEGTGVYQDTLSVTASYVPEGQTQQVIAVEHGLGDDWFANVLLSPTNATGIVVHDPGAGAARTNMVTWEAVNLLDNAYGADLAIRGGGALRFAGWPAGATNGFVSVTILNSATNAITNLVAAAGSAIPYRFDQAGRFMVSGLYSNGTTVTNGILPVRVVSGSFNGGEAACVTGQARTWDCPGITTDAVVAADSLLSVTVTNLAGGGTRFTLLNPTDGPLYMVARLGANGPVLDSAKVSAIQGDHGTYFKVVETFADGSRMTEVRLQLGYVPSDLVVQLHIFVGGVTFLDGTLNKTLTAADFNELGVCTYRLIQSAESRTSTCHTTRIYQGGIYIGGN